MIANFFATIMARWQLALGVVAAVVLCLGLSYCKGRADGRALVEAKYARAAAQAVAQARKADAVASDRRAADATRLTNDSNARKEAIDNAQPDTTDAPGRALACQRLRAAGIDPPAECG
jgi:hypothetical protein